MKEWIQKLNPELSDTMVLPLYAAWSRRYTEGIKEGDEESMEDLVREANEKISEYQEAEGFIGVICYLSERARMAVEVMEKVVDFGSSGEVWPYFVEDEADNLYKLLARDDEGEFRRGVLRWLEDKNQPVAGWVKSMKWEDPLDDTSEFHLQIVASAPERSGQFDAATYEEAVRLCNEKISGGLGRVRYLLFVTRDGQMNNPVWLRGFHNPIAAFEYLISCYSEERCRPLRDAIWGPDIMAALGTLAASEGWALKRSLNPANGIRYDVGMVEDDEQESFDHDGAAAGFVLDRALQGSDLHRLAIDITLTQKYPCQYPNS